MQRMRVRGVFRTRLINLLLVAGSLAFALLVSEILLRVYEDWFFQTTGTPADLDRAVAGFINGIPVEQEESFRWHPDGNGLLHMRSPDRTLVYELRPNVRLNDYIRTNELGFRDREFTPVKAPGRFRIIVAGDSVTFGWFEKEECLYPKVLERLLAQGLEGVPTCEVYNMAVGGYNAQQELELIQTKALPLHPDLIILQFCHNDSQIGADSGLWRHFNQTPLRTWDLCRLAWMSNAEYKDPEHLAPRCYRRVAALAQATGIPIVVALFPTSGLAQTAVEEMDAFVAALGLPALNLTALLNRFGLDNTMHDGIHPNALGHRLAGEALCEYLCAHPALARSCGCERSSYDFEPARAHVLEGLHLVNAGDVEGAASAFRQAVAKDLDYSASVAQILVKAANAFLAAHEDAKAAQAGRWAVSFDATIPGGHFILGLALAGLGDADGALAEYRQVRTMDRGLRFLLTQALWQKADSLRKAGQFEEAVSLCREAFTLYSRESATQSKESRTSMGPEHPVEQVKARVAEALAALAQARIETGNLEEALALCREALTTYPPCEPAKTAEGQVLERQGLLEQAGEAYRASIAIDPGALAPFDGLDKILGRQNNPSTRIAEWRKIVQDYPQAYAAHFHLALALDETGDTDGAIAAYRQAHDLNADHPVLRLNYAEALCRKGDYKTAVALLREALDQAPDAERPLVLLASALCETREYEEARKVVDRCQSLGIALPPGILDRLARTASQGS